MECRRYDRRYPKLSTKMETICQKIDYHADHCKEREIYEDLTVVGKISSCSCRTGIDYPNGRRRSKVKKLHLNIINIGLN